MPHKPYRCQSRKAAVRLRRDQLCDVVCRAKQSNPKRRISTARVYLLERSDRIDAILTTPKNLGVLWTRVAQGRYSFLRDEAK